MAEVIHNDDGSMMFKLSKAQVDEYREFLSNMQDKIIESLKKAGNDDSDPAEISSYLDASIRFSFDPPFVVASVEACGERLDLYDF